MDAYKAITTAMTVREYRQEKASDEVISKVLNAARMTASAMNKQPWSFVVVTDKSTLERIADLSQTGRHIGKASFAVAVITDPQNKWSSIDAARAIQSMTIEGWEEGLGSGWVGTIDREKVKEILSIPEYLELLTVIPFGYPTANYEGKKKRKSFDEVIFREKYGAPFQNRAS